MTDRQRRIAKLVDDIRAALDRGVGPEQIHSVLVQRKLPPEKATLLIRRIQAERARGAGELVAAQPAGMASIEPGQDAPAAPNARRRRRTPFFLALIAVVLVAGGFTGIVLNNNRRAVAEQQERDTFDLARRLDAEVAAARNQLAYLEEQLAERQVEADQIEWLRARVAKGPDSFESFAAYEDMYGIYERRRGRWNRTLPQYRVVADAYRTLAVIHNAKLDSLSTLNVQVGVKPAPYGADGYIRVASAASVRND